MRNPLAVATAAGKLTSAPIKKRIGLYHLLLDGDETGLYYRNVGTADPSWHGYEGAPPIFAISLVEANTEAEIAVALLAHQLGMKVTDLVEDEEREAADGEETAD